MANEHFFPGDYFPTTGLSAPLLADSYAPAAGFEAAAMAFGWVVDRHRPADSSATTAHFDSALSSLVSSPVSAGGRGLSHGGGGDEVAIGDLIGRLGSICNGGASADNSCYSTPLSSPPRRGYGGGGGATAVETGRLSRVASSSRSLGGGCGGVTLTATTALENPEAEEMRRKTGGNPAPPAKRGAGSSRKRKDPAKEEPSSLPVTEMQRVTTSASAERRKVGDGGEEEEEEKVEAGKEYIHVRARRGQATDSHSLAERVRRERISERMKLLQSLVPGCNKITGKALMLDEIINYVQSLQRQLEFLSMKLSTMNPELDFDGHRIPSKDVNQRLTSAHPSDDQGPFSATDMFAVATVHQGLELELENTFSWEQELQNMVQMGAASSTQVDPNALNEK